MGQEISRCELSSRENVQSTIDTGLLHLHTSGRSAATVTSSRASRYVAWMNLTGGGKMAAAACDVARGDASSPQAA